jgi:GNAT superfamily N-acetyltransferase
MRNLIKENVHVYSYTVFRHKSASLRFHYWSEDRATISHLRSKKRGKGHATKLLELVTAICDANEQTVILEARAWKVPGGLSQRQLVEFYEKFGFEPVWSDPVLMERKPKK